jgi:hypothetical protein
MKKSLIKIKSICFFIVFFTLIFFSNSATSKPYPKFYTGVRPIGMGGAFVAVSDDKNTLFYNPAGLSRINDFTLSILDPIVGVGKNSLDIYSDADDTDMDDTSEVTDLLRQYTGDHLHLYACLPPSIGFKIKNLGIMVSAFGIASIDSSVRNPVYPELHLTGRADIGGIGGIGFNVPGIKGLRAGLAFKSISRESIDEIYTPAQIASDDFEDIMEDDQVSSTGTGLDIGVIYTLPWDRFLEVDIALSGQNLPEIEFNNGDKLATEWTAGVALRKGLGPISVLAALDYRDFTNNIEEDEDIGKRIHMGAEIKFKNLIAIRGGFNQGYPTLGASLDLWILKFDAAMYSEEIGAYAGQKEDKRYMGQITIGW